MKRKWSYFIGAVVLASYYLLTAGAPPIAVGVGIAGAAAFLLRASHTT
jgi:hypothetical protein